MTHLRKTAMIAYGLATAIVLTFGFMYLLRSQFMPYHAVAVSRSWEQVDPAMQVLLVALMNVVAGGWIGSGVAIMAMLVFPFRSGQRWADFAIPVVGLIVSVNSLVVTLTVTAKSPATPPWIMAATGIGLLGIGFVLTAIDRTRKHKA
jgi:hypothetical protein